MQLNKALEMYLAHLQRQRCSRSHLATVRIRIGRFCRSRRDVDVAAVTPSIIENHFADLEEAGLAAGTLAGYKSSQRAFWAWLVEEQFTETNPSDALLANHYRYSYRPVNNRPAPAADFQQVLDALPAFAAHRNYKPRDVRDAALVSLTADSARRRGELWWLRKRDIELALARPTRLADGDIAYITAAGGKTGQEPVRFFQETADLLTRWLALMPANARFLWVSVRTGNRLRVDAMNLAFVRVCKFADVPTFRFHAVRKRDVIDIIEETGDYKVGQRLAGHKDERTTQIHYNEVDEARVVQSAAALSARRRGRKSERVDDLANEFFGGK